MLLILKNISDEDDDSLSQVKTLEHAQKRLIPVINLPAHAGEDEHIHILSVGTCRHRTNLSDMDELIATVAQQNPYLPGVRPT